MSELRNRVIEDLKLAGLTYQSFSWVLPLPSRTSRLLSLATRRQSSDSGYGSRNPSRPCPEPMLHPKFDTLGLTCLAADQSSGPALTSTTITFPAFSRRPNAGEKTDTTLSVPGIGRASHLAKNSGYGRPMPPKSTIWSVPSGSA